MKLELRDVDEPTSNEEISVRIWPDNDPPIIVPKHELTRWGGVIEDYIEDGELLLQDGYCDNWNEVNDCISLLKGLEVDVTFDNIKVLTTFGLKFNIVPLLDEIGRWFKSTLNAENFGRTINMIHKLKTIGFSEDELASKISITPAVIEFVNNSSREEFTNLLSAEFDDLDLVILKALFRGENNHFDILLDTLADKMNSEEQCEIILGLLKKMLISKHTEVLCVFSSEVNSAIVKIQSISSSNERLRAAVRFLTALKRKSDDGIGSPQHIRLGLLHRTRCWRRYSVAQLELLQNNDNVRSWHFAEIVLDWIEQEVPPRSRETIIKLRKPVYSKLDADVEILPYAADFIYRGEIESEFKRLLKAVNDQRGIVQCINEDFFYPIKSHIGVILYSLIIASILSNGYDLNFLRSFIFMVFATAVYAFRYLKTFCYMFIEVPYRWKIKVTLPKQGILKFAESSSTPVRVKQYCEHIFIFMLPIYCFNSRLFYDIVTEDSQSKSELYEFLINSSFYGYNGKQLYLVFTFLLLFLQMFSLFFYTNLRLLNCQGMGKIKLETENFILKKEYPIRHWYIKAYYDGVDQPFYSVFTHTYCEITEFLNERYEQSPKYMFSQFYRSVVYYLFGWSPINLQALY